MGAYIQISDMNVLYLAYYYPPAGGAGTQRTAAMVEHLAVRGYNVTVATSRAAGGVAHVPIDNTLRRTALQPQRVRVLRGGSSVESWLNWLASDEVRVLFDDKYDVVVATMSPFECDHLARLLADRHQARLVLDLRDPWALDGWREYRTYFHWRIDLSRMRRALRAADAVVMNTPEAKKVVARSFPRLDRSRLFVVSNGFDESDFARMPERSSEKSDPFTILHLGTLHWRAAARSIGVRGRMRSVLRCRPEPIIARGRTDQVLSKAAIHLIDSKAVGPAELRMRFVGLGGDSLSPEGESLRQRGVLETLPYLEHAESVRLLRVADALFLPLHGLRHGRRSRIVPGKTYEYLRSGRPILAGLPEGDAKELVLRLGSRVVVVDPLDVMGMASGIQELLSRRWDSPTCRGIDAELGCFERERLAEAFASVLEFAVGGKDCSG